MKWIGQHIWSFISRFRSDVYLENVTESAQDHVVGIDADGKLYKQDVATGDITGVTITTDSGGGSAASDTSGSADFSILGSSGVGVTNSGTTITATAVPGEIDHDSLLNFVTAEHYDWASDNSGTATIHTNNITDLHGAGVDGSANQLITDDGDGTVTSESGLTWDGDDFTISSATTNRPQVIIKDTANHAKPPMLFFTKDKGAAGGTGDSPGQIVFQGDNADQTIKSYVTLSTEVVDATAGDEAAAVQIDVATSNGSTSIARNVITGSGHATANTVNVELGYGATSTTTIAGTLTMGSTAAMTNAGLLSVAAQTNITSLGTLTGLTTSGAIELGHANDTTLARSASGKVTIEGNEIVTAGTVGISSGSQSPVGMMIARRTLTQAECNDLHNTPIEIIPTGGSNTIIQLIHTTVWVDRAAAQLNTACDLNMHYADQEPGTYFSSSIGHLRRIMYGETGDRVFSVGHLTSGETGQNLTDDVDKGVEVSFDSACTSNSFTTMDIICTYYILRKL